MDYLYIANSTNLNNNILSIIDHYLSLFDILPVYRYYMLYLMYYINMISIYYFLYILSYSILALNSIAIQWQLY